jgi:hypothetical protein
MKAAKKAGLHFYGLQYELVAYNAEAVKYMDKYDIDVLTRNGSGVVIPHISKTILSDSGADDYAQFLNQDINP